MKAEIKFTIDTQDLKTYVYTHTPGEIPVFKQNILDWLVELKHLYIEKNVEIISNNETDQETKNLLLAFNADDINLAKQMMDTVQIDVEVLPCFKTNLNQEDVDQ